MIKSTVLTKESFASEFERCCREYSTLSIACAWCGDPTHILPYSYLERESNNLDIKITTGIFFNQTHPGAISYFIDQEVDIKIFENKIALFHPKVYLFKKSDNAALFIGSSNLTYSGFFNNIEVNMLSEGSIKGEFMQQINKIENDLTYWHSDECSFFPTEQWLTKYHAEYKKKRKQEQENKISSPRDYEESISSSSWLRKANWAIYYQKVLSGLKEKERDEFGYSEVLNAAQDKLPLPWLETYFDNIEKRRIIGGMGKYGRLGHVAASGAFRKFMTSGGRVIKEQAIKAINDICTLEIPLDFKVLERNIDKLISTGHSIKVWSRILAIVRPDIYCTVASPSVRKNLSKTLEMPQNRFEKTMGYIRLLQLIHASPWYNSPPPKIEAELSIWKRRVAFLDAIFY